MKQFIIIFSIFSILVISCKKEYTQQEKNRIEALTTEDVYKLKVSDNAFVFCLDTIKTDEEYERFSEEFCRRGRGRQSYIYLSSYKVYIPVFVEYGCGTIGCYFRRNVLTMYVNRGHDWLINDQLINDFDQHKMDEVISDYFNDMEEENRGNKSIIRFNSKAIKNDRKRDSLYMNLITSYYNYIKVKKKETDQDIEDLTKKYSFNLLFEQRVSFLIPPPSINQEVIEIDKEIGGAIFE